MANDLAAHHSDARDAARQRLADVLDQVMKPLPSATETFKSFPQPGLVVDDIPIHLPVSDDNALKILESNDSEEHSHIIPAERIRARETWTEFVEKAISDSAERLRFPTEYTVVPSRLWVGKTGPGVLDDGKTAASRPGLFARVAVILPSKAEGGDLVLHSVDKTRDGGVRTESPYDANFDLAVTIWHASIFRSIGAIASGHKLVLEYDLVADADMDVSSWPGGIVPPCEIQSALQECLKHDWKQIYRLDQKPASPLGEREGSLLKMLRLAAAEVGCFVWEGSVTDNSWHEDGFDREHWCLTLKTPTPCVGQVVFDEWPDIRPFPDRNILAQDMLPRITYAEQDVNTELNGRVLVFIRAHNALEMIRQEIRGMNCGQILKVVDMLQNENKRQARRDHKDSEAFLYSIWPVFCNRPRAPLPHLQEATLWALRHNQSDRFDILAASLFVPDSCDDNEWPKLDPDPVVAAELVSRLNKFGHAFLDAGKTDIVFDKWLRTLCALLCGGQRTFYDGLEDIKFRLSLPLHASFQRWSLAQLVTRQVSVEDGFSVSELENIAKTQRSCWAFFESTFIQVLEHHCDITIFVAFLAELARAMTIVGGTEFLSDLTYSQKAELFKLVFSSLSSEREGGSSGLRGLAVSPYYFTDAWKTPQTTSCQLSQLQPVYTNLCTILEAALESRWRSAGGVARVSYRDIARCLTNTQEAFDEASGYDTSDGFDESEVINFLRSLATHRKGFEEHDDTRVALHCLFQSVIRYLAGLKFDSMSGGLVSGMATAPPTRIEVETLVKRYLGQLGSESVDKLLSPRRISALCDAIESDYTSGGTLSDASEEPDESLHQEERGLEHAETLPASDADGTLPKRKARDMSCSQEMDRKRRKQSSLPRCESAC